MVVTADVAPNAGATVTLTPAQPATADLIDTTANITSPPINVQISPGLYQPRGGGTTLSQFTLKQNDALPKIKADLKTIGTPVDLTGATVKFCMRPKGNPTPKVNASATIVDATTGRVEYGWVTADTDTAGTYEAEFEVTFSGGSKQTFPTQGYIEVTIVDDIA